MPWQSSSEPRPRTKTSAVSRCHTMPTICHNTTDDADSYAELSDSSQEPSALRSMETNSADHQPPHRRSLSTGALRPLLATASNFNSTLSLTNPLSLLSRGDSERSDCEQQGDETGSSLLENLFAIGQAAVEAANLSHGVDDNSEDDDISQEASQHSDDHGSQQDLHVDGDDPSDRNQV